MLCFCKQPIIASKISEAKPLDMLIGSFRGAKPLSKTSSPSPFKERGIKVEDSSRGEVNK
jgi:hypothetical protein